MSKATQNSQATTNGQANGSPDPKPKPQSREEKLAALADRVKAATRKGLVHFHEAGKALIEAKGIVGKYGAWKNWLEKELGMNPRTAQRYMEIAKCDVTSDLEVEWRRINGNAKRTGTDGGGGDQSKDNSGGDKDKAKDEIKPLAFKVGDPKADQFDKLVRDLGPILKTKTVTDTVLKALEFTLKAKRKGKGVKHG